MRIEVFAETSSTAEEIYNMCFSKLEAWAKENGWQMITERVLDAEETD